MRLKRAIWTTCCPQKIGFEGYPSLSAIDWDTITDVVKGIHNRGRLVGEMTRGSLCRIPGVEETLNKAVTDHANPEWSAEWATSQDLLSLHRDVKTRGLIVNSYNTRCLVALSSAANSIEVVFDTPTAAHAEWVLAANPAYREYAQLSKVTVTLLKPFNGWGTSYPIDPRAWFKCEPGCTPKQVVLWVYDVPRLMSGLPKGARVQSVLPQQDDKWGVK